METIDDLKNVSARVLIEDALAHIGAAKVQFLDSDDYIIREHVTIAYELLRKALGWKQGDKIMIKRDISIIYLYIILFIFASPYIYIGYRFLKTF